MKRLIFLLIFVLTPAYLSAENAPTNHRIGVILPLSGSMAYIGEDLQHAAQMADEKFDPEFKVDLIFEDNMFVPRNSVSAAQKLINNDHVHGLLVFGSSTAFAVANIAETNHVPMVADGVLEKISEGRKYVVRMFPSSAAQHKVVLHEIKQRGYKTIAIVSTTQDGLLRLRDEMVAALGKDVVYDEEFVPDNTDFGGPLARVQHLNPDAVYLLLLPPQASTFAKQLRALGYKGAFFGGPQVGNMGEIAAAQGAFDGMWFVNTAGGSAGDFFAEFEKRFGHRPIFETIPAYDSIKLLIEALRQPDPALYMRSVKNFQGLAGTFSATTRNDFDIPVRIYQVKNGKIEE